MTSDLVRWGGFAAMLGGVAYVAEAVVFATNPEIPLQDALLLLGYLLAAVGLVGFHALQKEDYGRIGRGGFWTVMVGSVAAIVATAVSLVGGAELDWLHGIGALGIIVGYVLYGAATLQAKVLPRWCGLAFIVVVPLGLLAGEYTTLVFGVVWLALGYLLWMRRGTATGTPSRVS